MTNHFPPSYFQRQDNSSDHNFYNFARKVVHIDEGAIQALTDFYAQTLPQNGRILDLMSSWRSHLPDDLQSQQVVGLGMNSEEMADNPQLDDYIVHNLNTQPTLPYDDNQFDAVICAVSVQYLTQPILVFRDVNRVLKPSGRLIVSFSNRCFPTKAVAIWLNMSNNQHMSLVSQYFELAGDYVDIKAESKTSGKHNPMFIVSAKKKAD